MAPPWAWTQAGSGPRLKPLCSDLSLRQAHVCCSWGGGRSMNLCPRVPLGTRGWGVGSGFPRQGSLCLSLLWPGGGTPGPPGKVRGGQGLGKQRFP